MTKAHRSHDEASAEMFRQDPSLAADYLNDVLATGDEVDLMMALKHLSTAFGGVQEIARQANEGGNEKFNLRSAAAISESEGIRKASSMFMCAKLNVL